MMRAPLKASDWWNYKIPPLLAIAWYALASGRYPTQLRSIAGYLSLYLLATVAIAGFGHVLLDAFDVEEDRLLGKPNLWSPLSSFKRMLLLSTLIVLSWLPWRAIPGGKLTLVLIGAEFVMFVLYAMPPLRLKERGFPGIAADAMYAHVLPLLWTWVTFSAIADSTAPPWFPVVAASWAFLVGTRHLLQHQVINHDDDERAGARTFVVRHGVAATLELAAHTLLPLEVVTFAFLLGVITVTTPLVALAFFAYAVWQITKVRRGWLSRVDVFGAVTDGDKVAVIGTLVMSRFYERWMPVVLLLALSIQQPAYLLLLVIHVLVFREGAREVRQELAAAFSR
jgi:4-hydroxybenzoate polyprenyltransferase